MAETTLRRKLLLLSFFLGSGAVLGGEPAKAQFYGREPDPYAYSAPFADPRYGDPYGDFDRPQRERPRRARRGAREDDGYALEEERGSPFGRDRTRLAALPPDADPAYSTPDDLDMEVDPNVTTRHLVEDATGRPAGTITIDTGARKLYLSLGGGQAMEYGVGVGRQGFTWKGEATIGRKAYWPGWTPPRQMLLRRPDLPDHMEGGIDNPLGARALYLFNGKRDTLFRIHGTNEPDTIGQAVSSGCIRMLNADVIDLYQRVNKGARVVVR
jgi:lipoprotein-anchoring transpeptidase ErfK/SrfK